jgi:hypothetical protein
MTMCAPYDSAHGGARARHDLVNARKSGPLAASLEARARPWPCAELGDAPRNASPGWERSNASNHHLGRSTGPERHDCRLHRHEQPEHERQVDERQILAFRGLELLISQQASSGAAPEDRHANSGPTDRVARSESYVRAATEGAVLADRSQNREHPARRAQSQAEPRLPFADVLGDPAEPRLGQALEWVIADQARASQPISSRNAPRAPSPRT